MIFQQLSASGYTQNLVLKDYLFICIPAKLQLCGKCLSLYKKFMAVRWDIRTIYWTLPAVKCSLSILLQYIQTEGNYGSRIYDFAKG